MASPLAPISFSGSLVGFVSSSPDGSPDAFLASVLRSSVARLFAEEEARQKLRSSPPLLPLPLSGSWLISDRD